MAAPEDKPSSLNPAALTLGVVTLLGVLSTITLTGTIGRVFRNHPDELQVGLALLLIGAAFLAVAGLPATDGFWEKVCSLTGVVLTLVGLLVGVWAGATSVADVERPTVSAQLVDDGLELKGRVTAGD